MGWGGGGGDLGHNRQCIKCGERFVAQRATRRFCSDQCRLRYHRAVWNDSSNGQLSTLLRRVADSIDAGQTVRSQVTRLCVLLRTYDRELMAREVTRHINSLKRTQKASST